MEVKNKTMYHIQNTDKFKNIWQVGNILTISDKFNSNLCARINDFKTTTTVDDDGVPSERCLNVVLKGFLENDRYKNISDDLAKDLLTEAMGIIQNTNLIHREYLLEQYRLKHYPNLPSRYHSIWLADESSLDYWKNILVNENELNLFKLKVTGELFKSSDYFVPSSCLSLSEMYEQSENYWNPDFSVEHSQESIEYLFQGKVKILSKEKIK